ncbi:MAG: hypothetical protein K0Q92_2261, partial [Steroidobacteraceae bacterium]|nr:hypothetical protein [Steroidobacteraceae bacterium]
MRNSLPFAMTILLTTLLAACGGENTRSPVDAPGADTSAKTQALETGAALLQQEAPLRAF